MPSTTSFRRMRSCRASTVHRPVRNRRGHALSALDHPVHVDVHAWRLGAHHRQYDLPVRVRQPRRALHGARALVAFYLLCGLGANALEIATAVNSNVPGLGASGAIAGVLGGYLVLYPTSRIGT